MTRSQSALMAVAGIVLAAGIVIGGWHLGWWIREDTVNRNARINRQSYEVQQTYREKSRDLIRDVSLIDAQIADPAYATRAAQLRAQRTATATAACDAIARLTTSGAGVDPDIETFRTEEC